MKATELQELSEAELEGKLGELTEERQRAAAELGGRHLVKTLRSLFRAWNERLETQA